ncbi:hypothetical protein JQC92_02450 [Shewanella sp. 202IG2-18]|uniref:hypothetical protein n=1 Tax=Parashewanella hymeniacidonis TaxID=2807618 RepID=UPI0019601226|nr:hypothetical protein [Parashewanella hymeniacidonis]MBM7070902.1 hypothetical protein [Parashewanella hymeniacidonis]
MNDLEVIRRKLQALLGERKLRAFAKKHELCHSQIHRVAVGEIKSPSYEAILKIKTAFDKEAA